MDDPDRLWSSRHSGASSIRGTIYMLALGAALVLVYLLTDWLWGAIIGAVVGLLAVLWFIFSYEEIVEYAKERSVLRLVLGVIFLALGLGVLVALMAVWDEALDPAAPSAGGKTPAVGLGFGIVVCASCLASGVLLIVYGLRGRRR